MTTSDDFLARQRAHFAAADVDHFDWQTRGPGFAEREAAFVREALAGAAGPLLEVGCGEGANLVHALSAPGTFAAAAAAPPAEAPGADAPSAAPAAGAAPRACVVGIDAFVRKLAFAAGQVPAARFACADGGRLPFRDATFATVFVRDLLHHLPEPRATLAEVARVLRPGGRFVLVEPNARNPLVRLQMAIVPAERGAARSDARWLAALLAGLPFVDVRFAPAAPFPLDRVVLHHRFGVPRLGRSRVVRGALAGLEGAVARLLPQSRWSYVVVHAYRAAAAGV